MALKRINGTLKLYSCDDEMPERHCFELEGDEFESFVTIICGMYGWDMDVLYESSTTIDGVVVRRTIKVSTYMDYGTSDRLYNQAMTMIK